MNATNRAIASLTAPPIDRHLYARISAEFEEMPGLRLTLPQAARLFGLDDASCRRIMTTLVDNGVLTTDGQAFARASFDRRRRWPAVPSPRVREFAQ
jgi:hypothetical protein